MDITSESATLCKIVATGPVPVNCDKEDWTYDNNGVITLPNASKPGDCIYVALNAAGCSISSITYNAASDQITVKLKYSFITISIVCSKVAEDEVAVVPTALVPRSTHSSSMTLAELVDKYYVVFSLQDPAGSYKGVKSILGQTVTAVVTFNAGSTLDFSVTGPVSIVCQGEAYTFSNGVISITNINKAGDCVHDALDDNAASLKSFTYDSSANDITLELKISIVSVDFTLQHQ